MAPTSFIAPMATSVMAGAALPCVDDAAAVPMAAVTRSDADATADALAVPTLAQIC